MSTKLEKHLTPDEINKLLSTYLTEGRKQDSWEIVEVDIKDRVLTARIRMRSTYTSPSDPQGFHLSIFTTLEFLSQLTIIYGHVWAGYEEKTQEGWMVESSIVTKQAIRDPENIRVHMDIISAKKVGDNLLGLTKSRVYDDQGGLFEARLKGFLS